MAESTLTGHKTSHRSAFEQPTSVWIFSKGQALNEKINFITCHFIPSIHPSSCPCSNSQSIVMPSSSLAATTASTSQLEPPPYPALHTHTYTLLSVIFCSRRCKMAPRCILRIAVRFTIRLLPSQTPGQVLSSACPLRASCSPRCQMLVCGQACLRLACLLVFVADVVVAVFACLLPQRRRVGDDDAFFRFLIRFQLEFN